MGRKLYEISFAIAGHLAGSFRSSFSSASSQVHKLKSSINDLSQSYRKGEISAKQYVRDHKRLTQQIDSEAKAQRRLNAEIQKQNRLRSMRIIKGLGSATMSGAGTVAAGMGIGMGGATIGLGTLMQRSLLAAATYEMNTEQIKAMFGTNKKLAEEYIVMLEKMAIDSPILDSQQMYANSKGVIAVFKNTKNARKNMELAWEVNEKLAASNPLQGVEGAAVALREMLSGDSVSMVERFEMPRSEINKIKKLKPEKQLVALNNLLIKMGFTEEFITRSAKTAVGQWNQMNEKINKGLRMMGEDGLNKVKPELERFNKWLEGPTANRVIKFGSDMISGILSAAISGVNQASSYINSHFINNPQFKKLSAEGKVNFVMGDLGGVMQGWFEKQSPKIAGYGAKIGAIMMESAAKSAVGAVTRSPLLALMLGAYIGAKIPGPIQLKAIVGVSIAAAPWVIKFLESVHNNSPLNTDVVMDKKAAEQAAADKWYKDNKGKKGPMVKGGDMSQHEPTALERTQKFLGLKGYATGGFVNRPVLAGEAGPEAIIPLNRSSRAMDLWQRTGEMLGAGTGDINVTFAPVIHGAGPEIIPELQRQQKSFMDDLKDVLHQRRRVAYGR